MLPSIQRNPFPDLFRRTARSFLVCLAAGLFPLFVLWNQNLGQVPASAVMNTLPGTLLFIAAVLLFWLAVTRSPEKSALLSCATIVFVFSYGHLYNLVGNRVLFGLAIGYVKLLLVFLVAFAAVCMLILRSKHNPDPFPLFYLFAALILLNLGSIVRFSIQAGTLKSRPGNASAAAVQTDDGNRPDIYYIVLDAYSRADVLQTVLGYDNTAFLEALRTRGFYIPACAFSNYDLTEKTIASVLNYDSLDHLGISINRQDSDQALYTQLIHDNQAAHTFRAYGYKFVTGRGYAAFNDIATADVYLNYAYEKGARDDLAEKRFRSLYLNTTVFRFLAELYKTNPERFSRLPAWLPLDRDVDPSLIEAQFWYAQNNTMFDGLEGIPEKPGSYLVYAHINAPHGPHVFRHDGSFRGPDDPQDENAQIVDELPYINRRVLEVVDTLLKKSNPAPIIIIQADHGIHRLTSGLDKHKILSAYYLPGAVITPPYATITPVNNFRLILNNYFDRSVQLLPDTLWVKFQNDYVSVPASCDLKP